MLHTLCLKPKFRRGWFRYSSNLVFKFLPRYYDLLNHQSVHATGEEHKPSPITLEIFCKISYTAATKAVLCHYVYLIVLLNLSVVALNVTTYLLNFGIRSITELILLRNG